jgi:hypothetical protein
MASALLIGLMGMVAVVGLAVLILYLRDRIAKAQGKTLAQVHARFAAILQFRSTLQYCIPGVLTIIFGIFWALDRSRQHESDWWIGLPFIPAGWLLILLLARRSWRRYLELQQIAEKRSGDCCNIPIALIEAEKGEAKAQTCAIGLLTEVVA